MAQDTKSAEQPGPASTLGITEAVEKDTTTQRPLPHQAMLGTQIDNVSESSKQETMEATTEILPSPAPEMVNQMMNQSLVQATCLCGRVTLPQETPTPSDLSSDQQQAT